MWFFKFKFRRRDNKNGGWGEFKSEMESSWDSSVSSLSFLSTGLREISKELNHGALSTVTPRDVARIEAVYTSWATISPGKRLG